MPARILCATQLSAAQAAARMGTEVDVDSINLMKYLRVSLGTQFLLAVYFQIVNWFPLGLWNYQPDFLPLISSVSSGKVEWGDVGVVSAFLLPFLLFFLAYWRQWTWLMWVGAAGYAGWFYLQIQTWWVPYLFGASDRWQETYHRVFDHSTKILPSFGNHLAPDAMHLTIQLLLFVIVTCSIVGLVRIQRIKKSAHLT
jgi:hypothetical protein